MDFSIIDSLPNHYKAKRIVRRLSATLPQGYGFLDLPHCYVRYRVAGNGPITIVFATDPPVTLESYDSIIESLIRDFKVIVFELPGFGFSFPKKSMKFDFNPAVDTLLACLKHWNAAPYVLAFPCASAFFARKMAEVSPETITHLVLTQCPSWSQEQAWVKRLDPKGILSTGFIGQVFMGSLKRKIGHEWVAFASHTHQTTQQLQAHNHNTMKQGGCYCLASSIQRSLLQDAPQFHPIDQPILSVYGDCDRSHKNTDFHSIKEHGHHTLVKSIPNTGHFPELENTPVFLNYLKSFISGSDAASASNHCLNETSGA